MVGLVPDTADDGEEEVRFVSAVDLEVFAHFGGDVDGLVGFPDFGDDFLSGADWLGQGIEVAVEEVG